MLPFTPFRFVNIAARSRWIKCQKHTRLESNSTYTTRYDLHRLSGHTCRLIDVCPAAFVFRLLELRVRKDPRSRELWNRFVKVLSNFLIWSEVSTCKWPQSHWTPDQVSRSTNMPEGQTVETVGEQTWVSHSVAQFQRCINSGESSWPWFCAANKAE